MAAIIRPYALLSLAVGAMAGPVGNHELFERATCKDNLGRCFNPTGTAAKDTASRAAATAFCSSFLSVPVVTSVVATVTPQTSLTLTATVTDATVTDVSVVTLDVEATETQQTTITTTLAGNGVGTMKKRADPTAEPPKCGKSATPESYSSACECVSVTPSTTYVTATAPVATNTALETLSETATTLTTETATVTTGTATVVETSVATQTPAPQTCNGYTSPYTFQGQSFTIECGGFQSNFMGQSWSHSNVASFAECVEKCTNNASCGWGIWNDEQNQCWTYQAVAQGSQWLSLAGYDSFYRV